MEQTAAFLGSNRSSLLNFLFDVQRRICLSNDGIFRASRPLKLEAIALELSSLGINPRQTKLLDLGSGEGYAAEFFARKGYQVYGVERAPDIAQQTKSKLEQLGNISIMHGDYSRNEFWSSRFSDGTTPGNIDVFYCFTYRAPHAREVVQDLAGEGTARKGSLLVITDQLQFPFLDELGFDTLKLGLIADQLFEVQILRKIASREPDYANDFPYFETFGCR